MTVTYTHEVANARLGGFSNLLLRWRGSVYKLFYKEFLIYIALYTILSLCYRHIDIPEFKTYFEKLCLQFQSYTDLVPISFVLGFYVSMVVGRWWQQYLYIPWPDRLMVIIAANVHGPDQRGRLIRRTLMRYLSLAQVLTYRSISTAVYKRFPTMQHVIDAGFLTQAEYKRYENVKTNNVKYFVPCVWFSNLLSKVRQEGRIYDDMTYHTILKELNDYRSCCGMLFSYDWISIPLVYTQVVTVAVYVFFVSTLLSRQYLDVSQEYPGHEVDLYVPIFTICQFFFYVGWLKVAEQLINPFGEDDDDFEVNSIIDRNLELSMLTVDDMYLSHPKLEKDKYWNISNPAIPYTAASANHKLDAFLGSTIDMSLDRQEMQVIEQPQVYVSAPNNNSKWDANHNLIDVEKQSLLEPPPSYVPQRQTTTRLSNPINFLKRFTGRDKDSEAQKSSQHKVDGWDTTSKEEEKNVKHDNDTQTGSDDSDADSDVGDGGGSEDDGSDDNKSDRRSSLSSVDGEESHDKTDPQKPIHGRKHSIGEPEDRPRAKKPKNNIILTPAPSADVRPVTLKLKTSEKSSKKGENVATNSSESILKSSGGRFSHGKGKKSPKKKNATTKFPKRLEFQRNHGEETEEERRNAQTRTNGLLKANKKKSVQALQRNARRVNYPGNAWLRYKYPLTWAHDYTSMTSGAEDHGRHDYDSPFGSINSFATSIPSPRPLRFSQFGRRTKRKHSDSVSISSCMTSPCANDDFSPSMGFLNGSPRAREDGMISMPFTEDLRRRLLVVNTANTPSSSNATSPVLGRAFQPGFPAPSAQESDDLLMIAPSIRNSTSGVAWENTLEVIGEIATSDKLQSANKKPNSDDKTGEKRLNHDLETSPDNPRDLGLKNLPNASENVRENFAEKSIVTEASPIQTPTVNNTVLTTPLEISNSPGGVENLVKSQKVHRAICRSKSCPDVPISKMASNLEKQASDTLKPSDLKLDTQQSNSTKTLVNDDTMFHIENETLLKHDSNSETDASKENTYVELPNCEPSEIAPLLPLDSGDLDSTDTASEAGSQKTIENEPGGTSDIIDASNDTTDRGDPILVKKHPPSVTSDMGYYSSKEEIDNNSITSEDLLSKIRHAPPAQSNHTQRAMYEKLSRPKGEVPNKGEVSQMGTPNDPKNGDEIPESVVIPASSDVVIDIA